MQLKKHAKNTVKNTGAATTGAKATQRPATRAKSQVRKEINKETGPVRDLGAGGSTEHRPKGKRGVKLTAQVIGENEGIPVYDSVPSANQIATDLKCGHAKSVQLRQIMINDNVDLHAAINIRDSWSHGKRKERIHV
jgi:hypothetical protein